MDVIRWRRIIIHEVAQIKEHLVDDTRAYLNQLPPHGKETYEGRICPNVPLLRHIGQLSHDPNIAELMDYDAGGLTLLGRLHQGECWDRQPDWLLARPLDKSAFFTLNADHVTNAIKTATPVWHFSKSFCKNEMRLSSHLRIRLRLRGKSTCLLYQFQHERDRATPLPRWSFPEAAASVAFAIVTDNDVGTPTVRRSEDWRGPTITQ